MSPRLDDLPRMPLLKHLEDLRRCLLRCVLFFAAAFVVCIYFSAPLFHFLSKPVTQALHGGKLAFTALTDPFMLYLKVGFIAALLASFPFFMTQLWLFISPALYPKERRWAVPFVFFSVLLFYAGAVFGYVVAFPVMVKFFLTVGQDFTPIITIKEYLSLTTKMLVGMGLAFETPTLMLLLSVVGLTTAKFYLKYFRHAILVIFVIAAVITPTPDMVNQAILAAPMLALYLVGILGSWIVGKRKHE
jgi:sec-independent protein translocase protein TatC